MRSRLLVLCAKRWWGISAFSSADVVTGEVLVAQWSCYQELSQMKKRKSGGAEGTAQHVAAVESDLFCKLAPIIAHCAATKYDDGEQRKPGWITIKTMGSAWVVEVKDPDTCSRLVVIQQTLDDALMLASVLLESEEAPWEHDQWLAASAAKGKKK